MRRAFILLGLVLLFAGGGCGSDLERAGADGAVGGAADGGGLEVADVSGEDPEDAIATLEAEGLIAEAAPDGGDEDFADVNDLAGCDLLGQEPEAGTAVSEGDVVTLFVDCRQADWEDQAGDEWGAFTDALATAGDEGCEALFGLSPDGSLYSDGTEYTDLDCPVSGSVDPDDVDVPVTVPDDPDAVGAELGFDAGCQAFFDDAGLDALFHGTEGFDVDQCQAENPARLVSRAPAGGKQQATETSSDDCRGTDANGSGFRITDTAGTVVCKGALALWAEYVRRAPNEGIGSGAVVRGIDGWDCIAAPAGQSERLGGCNTDDGDEFIVRAAG